LGKLKIQGAHAWIQWGITLDEFAHVPAPNPTKKSKPNRSQSEERTITQKWLRKSHKKKNEETSYESTMND
jgi:hypothetical protein